MAQEHAHPGKSARTGVVWEVLAAGLARRAERTGAGVLDVVDLGGGTGGFAVPLARLGHRVTVVDPSPDALAALERRAADNGVSERVRAVQGDLGSVFEAVAKDSADAVLCHGVLEVADDPVAGHAARRRGCCGPAGWPACWPRTGTPWSSRAPSAATSSARWRRCTARPRAVSPRTRWWS